MQSYQPDLNLPHMEHQSPAQKKGLPELAEVEVADCQRVRGDPTPSSKTFNEVFLPLLDTKARTLATLTHDPSVASRIGELPISL